MPEPKHNHEFMTACTANCPRHSDYSPEQRLVTVVADIPHPPEGVEYTDDLLNSTDAMKWAEAFCYTVVNRWDRPTLTPGEMVGWFANAMVAQEHNDKGRKDLVDAIVKTVEYVGARTLPAIQGWSWYDALRDWAPLEAMRLREEYVTAYGDGKESHDEEVGLVGVDDAMTTDGRESDGRPELPNERRLHLVVQFKDHSVAYYPIPEGQGWKVDARSRCLMIGRGVPRRYVPLDNIDHFDIEECG